MVIGVVILLTHVTLYCSTRPLFYTRSLNDAREQVTVGSSKLQSALQRLENERSRLQRERDTVEAVHTSLSDIRIQRSSVMASFPVG